MKSSRTVRGSAPFPDDRSAVRWGKRGFWAITDQLLTAGSNFILSVLLARWLTETGYGSFSVAYSILLLIAALHTAVITEPMLVFAQGSYADSPGSYLRFVHRAHWLATSVAALLGLIAVGVLRAFGERTMAQSLLVAALAAPPFLLSLVGRRAAFAYLRPRLAALASGVYGVVLLTGLALLHRLDALRSDYPFALLALAGALSGGLVIVALRAGRTGTDAQGPADAQSALARHWSYGRWALATAVLTWVPGNVYYFVIPIRAGLAGSGALRALVNLTTPMMHLINALGVLTIPAFARRGRLTGSFRTPGVLLVLFTGGPLLYWLLLGLLGPAALEWLYGGSYTEHASVLWILGLLPPLAGLIAVLGAELRARERPDLVFFAYLVASLVTCTIGVALTLRAGLAGASLGWTLSYVVTIAMFWWMRRRKGLAR